jgi:hypothetical protein
MRACVLRRKKSWWGVVPIGIEHRGIAAGFEEDPHEGGLLVVGDVRCDHGLHQERGVVEVNVLVRVDAPVLEAQPAQSGHVPLQVHQAVLAQARFPAKSTRIINKKQ